MRLWLLLPLLAGCKTFRNDCGTYLYKGVIGTEWCGDVYGSEGDLYENEDDPSTSWAEIHFRHTVPPGEFDFDHVGSVRAWFRWEDLLEEEVLGPDLVRAECFWIDYRDPRYDSDDVEFLELATEFELIDRGRGFNLDPGNTTVRDLEWHVVCGEGELRLDAHDTIKFDLGTTSGLHQDLAAHLEGGE